MSTHVLSVGYGRADASTYAALDWIEAAVKKNRDARPAVDFGLPSASLAVPELSYRKGFSRWKNF